MLSQLEKQNTQLVWNGMAAILETKDEPLVEQSFAENFIQHNPWAKDGLAHVKEMLQFDFGYKPIRWVAEGDIMAYHGYYTAPNPLGEHPLLCVDMWRIENGKIREHWDALLPMPAAQVANATAGGGLGEKEVSTEVREANKASVKRFLDQVLNRGRVNQLGSMVSEDYTYHHESEGELKGHNILTDHLLNKNNGRMPHDNKAIIASGDLVMAHSHFFGPEERVSFDWFRMDEHARIAEHWSVSQPIISWEEAANEHPHF